MKDTERERQRQRQRQREKQAPCREPDMGLDPGSPGSHPGLKAGTKLLSHLGCPPFLVILMLKLSCLASGSPFRLAFVSSCVSILLEHLPALWHSEMFQAHPAFPPVLSWNRPSPRGSLVPFSGKGSSETKISVLDMVTATEVSVVSGLLLRGEN